MNMREGMPWIGAFALTVRWRLGQVLLRWEWVGVMTLIAAMSYPGLLRVAYLLTSLQFFFFRSFHLSIAFGLSALAFYAARAFT